MIPRDKNSKISRRVAANLRSIRKKKNVRVKELCEAVGVNERSYFRFESGDSSISIERLYVFADVLGVSVLELLGEKSADEHYKKLYKAAIRDIAQKLADVQETKKKPRKKDKLFSKKNKS